MDVILKGIIVYLKMIDKSILLFLLVSYASGCLMLGLTLDKTLDVASLQAAELAMHNEKRAIYGSSAISLDAALNTAAQAYADYLATNNLFAHSSQAQSGSYGENLYKDGDLLPLLTCLELQVSTGIMRCNTTIITLL
jgi:hypothetical protein